MKKTMLDLLVQAVEFEFAGWENAVEDGDMTVSEYYDNDVSDVAWDVIERSLTEGLGFNGTTIHSASYMRESLSTEYEKEIMVCEILNKANILLATGLDYEQIFTETLDEGGYSESKVGRYKVAISDEEFIVKLGEFTPNTIRLYSDAIKKANSTYTLGTWYNEENQSIYLDVSLGFEKLSQALTFAREHKQLAIYDSLKKVTIKL